MTIRFAAARNRDEAVLARVVSVPAWRDAANDNASGTGRDGIGRDALLRAALKHFAAHGLAAADRARANAEEAFFAGDRATYRHWLDICRALDRRMAAAVAARAEHAKRDASRENTIG